MAYTANYNFEKPVPGNSNGQWGTILNTTLDSIDTALYDIYQSSNQNYCINGGYEYSQYNGANTITVATNTAMIFDMFRAMKSTSTAGGLTAIRTAMPNTTTAWNYRSLYAGKFYIATTTSIAAITSTMYQVLKTGIEGTYYSALRGASNATLSFQIYANTSGTYCVSLYYPELNKSYIQELSITGNTWEEKSFTFAPQAISTLDNSAVLQIRFCFAGGSNYQNSISSWITGDYYCSTQQSNFFATATSQILITQLVLNEGQNSIKYTARHPAIEQMLIRRYYEKSYELDTVPGAATISAQLVSNHPATGSITANTPFPFGEHPRFLSEKATAPSLNIYDDVGTNGRWKLNTTYLSLTVGNISKIGFTIDIDYSTSVNVSRVTYGHWTADANIV